MSANTIQSKYQRVPLADLIVGGEGQARHVMLTGPMSLRSSKKVNSKVYGSLAFKAEGEPNVAMISFGDLNRNGTIDYPDTPTIPYSPYIHDYVVRPGDILLRGRGFAGSEKVSVAAYIDRQSHDEALRSLRKTNKEVYFAYNSSLLRIRLKDEYDNAPKLDAEYLAAFINSPEAQRYLTKHNQGGLVVGVTKSDILGLPVALPSLSEQKQLVHLIRAQAEYARVSARLGECYGLLANHAFNRS
jgi:hypothetical protein